MQSTDLKALILTSTISPGASTHSLKIVNQELRLRQTVSAIRRWRKSLPESVPIIIGDNSSGFGELVRQVERYKLKNVRLISVTPVPQKEFQIGGAGLSECNTILTILQSSELAGTDLVLKCNARYFVFNWKVILDRLPIDTQLAFWPGGSLKYVETGFYVAQVDILLRGLPTIMPAINESSGIYVEHLYPTLLGENQSGINLFQFAPAIKGVRGHTARKEDWTSEAFAIFAVIKLREQLKRLLRRKP